MKLAVLFRSIELREESDFVTLRKTADGVTVKAAEYVLLGEICD